ncbi:hypothetical protein NHX12_020477 [Muraenolepis orangiensis]|uniref:Aryl hydrocarbon receptor nuclear translocator-like protein 2 n=1 Tax=Muraenolepis orangiensis TaxID=630683 RepID=A0A9Q0ERY1_9TELE|nr:hypothetical protein NHX12_020477 [Muraenolepis orangiensis]
MAAQDAGGSDLGIYGTAESDGAEEGDSQGEASWTPTSCTASVTASAAELPRKRKGEADCFQQEPHRQMEKRRRDKMNHLIEELAAMLPSSSAAPRKLDKLTVLRAAVQHLKALNAGTMSTFPDSSARKPSFLPEEDLKHMVLRLELRGQSLFHFLHPKDITKVKEQLSASEFPRERLVDARTGAKLQDGSPVAGACLSTGARRSFFCRMKHCVGSGNLDDKSSLPGTSKKKDSYRYCTVHCTGYMRRWPAGTADDEGPPAGRESSGLTCLPSPHTEVNVKPTEFVMRWAIDGKFTFVDQQATVVIGYLPQEVLGTSCYEYFHQDDLPHLAEKHRQEDPKRILPIMYSGAGKMIYSGSIGSQIANELIDAYSHAPFTPRTAHVHKVLGPNKFVAFERRCEPVRTAPRSGKISLAVPSQHPDYAPSPPGLDSDEAAMAVIMSLLESDSSMGQEPDFEDIHWPV